MDLRHGMLAYFVLVVYNVDIYLFVYRVNAEIRMDNKYIPEFCDKW